MQDMNHNNKKFWISINGMKDIKNGNVFPDNRSWLRTEEPQYNHGKYRYTLCSVFYDRSDREYNSRCPIDAEIYVCMMCKI